MSRVWDVPAEWETPSDALLERAVGATLTTLKDTGEHGVTARLASYYRTAGNYAGITFAELEPIDPDRITATDLQAVSLLSVRVKPRATRLLLGDGPIRLEIETALEKLSRSDDLEAISADQLVDMADFYSAVKRALSDPAVGKSNPWVTASKLCARKRPGLFPVRDNSVCALLGLIGNGRIRANYEVDWLVYQQLMRTEPIVHGLDRAAKAIRDLGGDCRVDQHRLRILDAALWTYTV
jgi:hypothetical protein